MDESRLPIAGYTNAFNARTRRRTLVHARAHTQTRTHTNTRTRTSEHTCARTHEHTPLRTRGRIWALRHATDCIVLGSLRLSSSLFRTRRLNGNRLINPKQRSIQNNTHRETR